MDLQASIKAHPHHEHHWETSWAPITVAFGIVFLVPIAFAAYFVYDNTLLAICSVGVGTPLLLAGVSGWIYEGATQKLAISDVSPIGIGVFIIGEILIFVSLFAGYWTMRITAGVEGEIWPPKGTPHINLILPLAMTAVLVASSIAYDRAEHELDAGKRDRFNSWLLISIALGITFLGCTVYEYAHLGRAGFVPSTNSYSTAFYSLTGFHAAHVLVGLLTFAAVLIATLCGHVHRNFVKVAGIYWHFVDIAWFFVASQVYYW